MAAGWTASLDDLTQQVEARNGLAAYLDRRDHDATSIANALLVMTELATNAFVHGRADVVHLAAIDDDDELVLRICHEHQTRPVFPANPTMPAPRSLRGRGLAIVDAIARRIDIEVTQTTTCVEAALGPDGH